MVDKNTVRTYGVNQVFQYVEGIWLHRMSRQIKNIFEERPILYARNMYRATIL